LKRQDDIVAELRANLESQLEDKESELGRPLTAAEAETWLKQMGPPIQVAARYLPQRYLIGPGVFPMFRHVLQLAITWAIIIYAIVTAVQILTDPPSATALAEALFHLPVVLMYVVAWVTAVFAALEYAVTRYPAICPPIPSASVDWSPAALPPVERETAPGTKLRSYAQAVAEVVFGFLALIWLLLIPDHPYLLLGPGVAFLPAAPFQLAPVWAQFYWWIVALNVVQLGWRCESLWRGKWQRPQPWEKIVISAMGLFPLGVVLSVRDHALVTLKHPALDQAHFGATLDTINTWTYRSFLIIFALTVLQLVWEIWQVSMGAYRRRMAAEG
jgi:hypothetical protein